MTDFPEILVPFKEEIEAKHRPFAILSSVSLKAIDSIKKIETTRIVSFSRIWEPPTFPVESNAIAEYEHFVFSDKYSFCFQLALSDIPAACKLPHVPNEGMIWVFMDTSAYDVKILFDSRNPSECKFSDPKLNRVHYIDTFPVSHYDITCLESEFNWVNQVEGVASEFFDYVSDVKYATGPRASHQLQLGGWLWPIQGEFDDKNKTFVAALFNCNFGDAGCLEIHYDPKRGWFGNMETH